MFPIRIVCLLLAVFCLLGLAGPALAAQVDCDATYCFTSEDFSAADEPLAGICITGLPDPQSGTLLLGSRVLRAGDILAQEQLAQMTFAPLRTQQDAVATIRYLPIYQNRVEKTALMTIGIRGKEDKAPVATDSSMETYRNLPNQGKLCAEDPEGQALTFTLVRSPKRGQVELHPDGSFTYTPKKNKTGVDSFTFTATDPAGNVSREATLTVQILKNRDGRQYTDTADTDCRFEAEWMRNTGLFVGEQVGGESCFYPQKAVSRGEFLAMAVKVLDIPVEDASYDGIPQSAPAWMKPYLAAALRSGLTVGWPDTQTADMDVTAPITGAEAAVLLQNALDLTVNEQTLEADDALTEQAEDVPVWAATSLTVMNENGVQLDAAQELTRGDVAKVLYRISRLAINAPGTAVFKMQQ